MPSEEEVRKAVELLETVIPFGTTVYFIPGGGADVTIAIRTIIAVAQSVLNCKGLPEGKNYESALSVDYKRGHNSKVEGFNEALRLCKLAAAKERLKKEDR